MQAYIRSAEVDGTDGASDVNGAARAMLEHRRHVTIENGILSVFESREIVAYTKPRSPLRKEATRKESRLPPGWSFGENERRRKR